MGRLKEDAPPQEENPKKFKGVWIPSEIWENTDITWLEKCLWAEISALGTPDDPCYASNQYLAAKLNSSPASIANMISKLRTLKMVKDVAFDGRKRWILALTPELSLTQPDSEPSHNPQVNKGTSEAKREGTISKYPAYEESCDEEFGSCERKEEIFPSKAKDTARTTKSKATPQVPTTPKCRVPPPPMEIRCNECDVLFVTPDPLNTQFCAQCALKISRQREAEDSWQEIENSIF